VVAKKSESGALSHRGGREVQVFYHHMYEYQKGILTGGNSLRFKQKAQIREGFDKEKIVSGCVKCYLPKFFWYL
jgi:hypothetical protein